MTHAEAARILLARHSDEIAAACDAKDSDRLAALAMVPVKVWLEEIAKENRNDR
jgi:hypothetical protein